MTKEEELYNSWKKEFSGMVDLVNHMVSINDEDRRAGLFRLYEDKAREVQAAFADFRDCHNGVGLDTKHMKFIKTLVDRGVFNEG